MNDQPLDDENKDTVVGRLKQAAADLTDDDELETEGETQEAAGKVKNLVDKASDKLKEGIDAAREKLD